MFNKISSQKSVIFLYLAYCSGWFNLLNLPILLQQNVCIHHQISVVAGDCRCHLCAGEMSLPQGVLIQHLGEGQWSTDT